MSDSESAPQPDEWLVVSTGDHRALHELSGRTRIKNRPAFWLFLGLFVAGYASMFVLSRRTTFPYSDEVFRFAVVGLEVLPFVPLILLATLARWSRPFRFATLAYWFALALLGIATNTLITMAAVIDVDRYRELVRNATPEHPPAMLDAFPLGSLNQVAAVLILTVGAIVAGLLGFFSTVRRLAARWLPLDPDSFPDSVALATTIAMTIGCFIPLVVLRQPPLLVIADHFKDYVVTLANQGSFLELYARLYWTLPVAILAAGFPLVRDFPAALHRLGIVLPSRGQLLMVPVCTLFLIGLMLVVDRAIGTVWRQVGLPVTDETTFEQLMKFAKSGAGAIAIGVTAGICEELTFRGLLQPRIGLWPANLLFTAVHAQQYHLDGLLSVFLIGLILGRIRDRTNTTTSMLIHGLYDFILVLGWSYEWRWLSSGN